MAFHEVDAHELTLRPFDAFDRGWALLAAGNDAASNCMTISWGGLGTLWNKPVATAYVRQSRYTKQFLDGSDTFSVNLFDGTERPALGILGRVSGRDGDKLAKTDLTQSLVDGTPVIDQARVILVCRKAYVGPLAPAGIRDPKVEPRNYSGADAGNYHTMYVGYVESTSLWQTSRRAGVTPASGAARLYRARNPESRVARNRAGRNTPRARRTRPSRPQTLAWLGLS